MAPGVATAPLRPGGTPTLPKATVQLQAPTQPLGTSFSSTPSQSATLFVEEEEEVDPKAGLYKILSGVGLAAAVVVMVFQLNIAKIWINAEDNPKPGDWSQLFE